MGDFWEIWACWGFWNLSKTTSTVSSEWCLFHIGLYWEEQAGSDCFLQEFCAFFSFPWVSDSLVNVELSCRLTCTIPAFANESCNLVPYLISLGVKWDFSFPKYNKKKSSQLYDFSTASIWGILKERFWWETQSTSSSKIKYSSYFFFLYITYTWLI